MATTTVKGKQAAATGATKFVSISVGTASTTGYFSVHDCADPGQASALNCVYPQNFSSPDGVAMKNGICVMTSDASGSYTVTHT